MIKSVLSPDDGTAIAIGEPQEVDGGVVINDAFFALPHFVLHDGSPPEPVPHQWRLVGEEWHELVPPSVLSAHKATLTSKVDDAVLEVYRRPILFAREYELREGDAQAFKDAGYAGEPGAYLRDFALSAGLAMQAAADLVLTQAQRFRGAEPVLANLRMRKYEIQRAANRVQATQIYEDIVSQVAVIKGQLN